MPEPKVQLRHPQAKHMPAIDANKYETVRKAILAVLKGKELTHTQMFAALQRRLSGRFDGNISWYGEGVKLDLEARKIIRRTDSTPQRYRLRP